MAGATLASPHNYLTGLLSVVVEIFNRLFTPPLTIRTFHLGTRTNTKIRLSTTASKFVLLAGIQIVVVTSCMKW